MAERLTDEQILRMSSRYYDEGDVNGHTLASECLARGRERDEARIEFDQCSLMYKNAIARAEAAEAKAKRWQELYEKADKRADEMEEQLDISIRGGPCQCNNCVILRKREAAELEGETDA